MSANVESMFSVREVPWHGLGVIIEDAPTSDDALRLAGLDWKVTQSKVICKDSGVIIPGYKANIRDTDGKVLGMVTDKYKIVQNTEAFAFTDALLGEGVTYETAGSLSSGKRVWMLARMEGRKITDEIVDPYLVFTNSHDGSGAVRVAITPIRVCCNNTLNMALSTANRHWSCVHKGDIMSKMEEAKRTLINTETYMEALEEEFGELKLQAMSIDKVKEYINMLIPLDETETSRTKIRNIESMRQDLMCRYLYAPDLRDIEHSAYRFVNAVSDFATHREPYRRTANYQENMFMKTVDGNAMIDMAYKMVKEMVA